MLKKTIMVLVFLNLICIQADALERFEIVTTENLQQLLELREQGNADFILINTLDEIIFRNSAIPGSINIPWSRIDETVYRAGDDKDKLLVMY